MSSVNCAWLRRNYIEALRLDGQNFVQLVVKITTPLLAGARNNLTLSDDGALIKDVLRCAVEWSAISILVPEQVENVYN